MGPWESASAVGEQVSRLRKAGSSGVPRPSDTLDGPKSIRPAERFLDRVRWPIGVALARATH
jgi:hypothetical protein